LEIRHALEGEPVSRFMKADPVVVPASASLQQFLDDYVYQYYFDMFPVVEDGRFMGCVTARALKQIPRSEWGTRTVGDLAERCGESNTISPNTDAVEALATMSRTQKSRLLVADGGRIGGIITLKDLLNFLDLKLDLEDGSEDSRELAAAHR
jgi:CBS domain-containing protein